MRSTSSRGSTEPGRGTTELGDADRAQPYFRVFNPTRQQRRFDPAGVYVKHWVPELRRLPDEWLTQP